MEELFATKLKGIVKYFDLMICTVGLGLLSFSWESTLVLYACSWSILFFSWEFQVLGMLVLECEMLLFLCICFLICSFFID